MLHALLHGKLADGQPEPQRVEDGLTSSVFGTLLFVQAVDVLRAWLGEARDHQEQRCQDLPRSATVEAWFWPRLALAEPDVVLRLGRRVIVIEAKYRAGRHDLAVPPVGEADAENHQPPLADQLARQVRSFRLLADGVGTGPMELVAAVRIRPPTFIFLVDRRRMASARREYQESRARVPRGTDLRLLTWQDLSHVLAGLAEARAQPRRWATDLQRYLELTGLAGFTGISRLPKDLPGQLTAARVWARDSPGGLRASVESVRRFERRRLKLLRRWSIGIPREAESGSQPDRKGAHA